MTIPIKECVIIRILRTRETQQLIISNTTGKFCYVSRLENEDPNICSVSRNEDIYYKEAYILLFT